MSFNKHIKHLNPSGHISNNPTLLNLSTNEKGTPLSKMDQIATNETLQSERGRKIETEDNKSK